MTSCGEIKAFKNNIGPARTLHRVHLEKCSPLIKLKHLNTESGIHMHFIMFFWKRVIVTEANKHEFQTRVWIALCVERRGSASVPVTSSCTVFPGYSTPRTVCFVANLKFANAACSVCVHFQECSNLVFLLVFGSLYFSYSLSVVRTPACSLPVMFKTYCALPAISRYR